MVSESVGYVALAFALSILIVLVVIWVAHTLIRRTKDTKFFDIIRDDDWYPSLALFQFMVWAGVVAVLFLGIYLTRAFAGVLAFPPTIPTNLLTLLGISVAVPVVSGGISNIKYTTDSPKERPEKQKLEPFSTMLQENGKPTLTRFQMFIWTWLGIIIYLALFIAMITAPGALQAVQNLSLPDIDPTLVVLMGVSQGGYLGGKAVANLAVEIDKISPLQAKVGDAISILGSGFGTPKDAVWFDDSHVPPEGIDKWSSSRVDLKVPVGLTTGAHKVMVVVGSSKSDPKDFTVIS